MEAKATGLLNVTLSITVRGHAAENSSLQNSVTEAFLVFRDSVFRYLACILHDPAEAEDLTQEVFLKLFKELQNGGEITNLRGWLFRVAHNTAVDRQRALRSRPTEEACCIGLEVESPAPDAESASLKNHLGNRLHEALYCLSTRERCCFELRAEGLRYREIAEALDIRISTVQTFLARAIRKIARQLDA